MAAAGLLEALPPAEKENNKMVLCLNYKEKEKMVVIKLADIITEEEGLKFLHSLDFEDLYSASLCNNDGIIIYKIKAEYNDNDHEK